MKKTVKELALIVGGEPLGLVDIEIKELASIRDAHAESISPLLRKDMLKEAEVLPGAVLTTSELKGFALDANISALIVHDNPAYALSKLVDLFFPEENSTPSVHPSAVVDQNTEVHPSASIGPMVVIESGVSIGEGSVIGPGAKILKNSKIGKHVVIGPGAVIGSDGFGYAHGDQGPKKIRHVGNVIIENHVEIGANTCVDRATLGSTVVGESSKLDNLVQVGHNTRIGKGVLIAGQVGLAGSTTVGDGAMLGGQVGIADHLKVGTGAKVAAKSGVTKHVEEKSTVAGYPAINRAKWLRSIAWLLRASECEEDLDTEDR